MNYYFIDHFIINNIIWIDTSWIKVLLLPKTDVLKSWNESLSVFGEKLWIERNKEIEIIKKILLDVIKDNADSKIEISYIGAPKYRVSIIAQEFKTAEKIIKPILEKIEKDVKKQNGTFNFTREGSRKTGEG